MCFRIFGHDGADAEAIRYVNWLLFVHKGLVSIDTYSPESGSWGNVGFAQYEIWCLLRPKEQAKLESVAR